MFGERDIRINRFLSVGENAYSYRDVDRVLVSKRKKDTDGNTFLQFETVIVFTDGARWDTQRPPRDLTPDEKMDIARLVAQKAKVPIAELDMFPEASSR